MSDKPEDMKTNPKRRWLRIGLIVSLGLNVLIIGAIGGAILRGGPPSHVRPGADISALGLRPYYRSLDEAGQAALRESVAQSKGEYFAGRKAMRAHLKALAALLAAEPYDAEAVRGELRGQAERVSANVAFGHKLLLQQIDAMSPEERQALAENLRKPPKKRKRFKRQN